MAGEKWGKKCDRFFIFNADDDVGGDGVSEDGDVVTFAVSSNYDNLWLRTQLAVEYINAVVPRNFDFIAKADDDSYLHVQRLKDFLRPFESDARLYFGFPLIRNNVVWMSGGAGYIMSIKAFESLNAGLGDADDTFWSRLRKTSRLAEDQAVGIAMAKIGSSFLSTVDHKLRLRQSPIHLKQWNNPPEWLLELGSNVPYAGNVSRGFECCSEEMISYHYVEENELMSI